MKRNINMNENQENVANLFPEHETASVTQLGSKDQTTSDGSSTFGPSVRKALLFSALQIIKAIYTLILPIFMMIIGFGIILTYIMFPISVIALIFSDYPGKSLEMMAIVVMMYLFCQLIIYILAWIKVKLGLA